MKALIILGLLLTSATAFSGDLGEGETTCVEQVQTDRNGAASQVVADDSSVVKEDESASK